MQEKKAAMFLLDSCSKFFKSLSGEVDVVGNDEIANVDVK